MLPAKAKKNPHDACTENNIIHIKINVKLMVNEKILKW